MDDDELYETPPAVIGSIAAGVGPMPFLGIYAVLFLAHGLLYPVSPPDITSSRAGEAVAGFIALALIGLLSVTIWWFLNRRRRWPFVIGQLATLATAVDFVIDPSTGPAAVPFALGLTSLTALVLAFAPDSWQHMRSRRPAEPGAAAAAEKQKYVGRRRRSGAEPDEPAPAETAETAGTADDVAASPESMSD